ncbi:acetyl xylan esterase [Cronobacter malonaticus]|uniref:Acetyl xylan esterase n=1 Tax=Cronobacter malonaticus TaxID=413503 RepID=V5TXI4_9ENTR|nr:hypothetical protein P262_01275 [Cronobacter malonaticus]ALX77530.1 acetyl xylan esterase [Cronobacter malonaticus LMG 23826]CCJ93826.1 hypothetical protein BN131_1499 [Cronobacter malonaticus 681]EGT4278622.1 acetyl xylan esterase [Cronobacter malonaticus]EGT4295739.1 acetyl xylan esterase [Cronobacter malonaticus]
MPQAAPRLALALALAGSAGARKRMQNHAPYACMAFLQKISGICGNF